MTGRLGPSPCLPERCSLEAPGVDTRGPPGWEPDLRWRGWGAEFHLQDRSVSGRACFRRGQS